MTDTPEPTEEQREVAARYYANGRELTPYVAAWVKTGEGCDGDNVDSLARLLAEREHRAAAYWRANEAAARADARVVMEQWRADVATHRAWFMRDIERAEKLNAELRADLDAAREDRNEARRALAEIDELVGPGGDGTTFGRVESSFLRHQMLQADLDAARARIAELEKAAGEVNDALGVLDLCMVVPFVRGMEEREAAHLAHIKALRDHIKHADADTPAAFVLAKGAHYDVEGEKPAVVQCQSCGVQNFAGSKCWHCDVEGGEG